MISLTIKSSICSKFPIATFGYGKVNGEISCHDQWPGQTLLSATQAGPNSAPRNGGDGHGAGDAGGITLPSKHLDKKSNNSLT